jgi:hypothetical protein
MKTEILSWFRSPWFRSGSEDIRSDGLRELHHGNGQLEFKGNFKDGLREGSHELYYDDSQLECRGNYMLASSTASRNGITGTADCGKHRSTTVGSGGALGNVPSQRAVALKGATSGANGMVPSRFSHQRPVALKGTHKDDKRRGL